MEALAIRLRLPGAGDRAALFEAGLHERLVTDCQADIRQAVDGATQVLHDRDEVDLVELRDMLAVNLAARPAVAELVREAAALGGTPLDETELYRAIAVWIVDLQLGDGLIWRPATPITRRPKRR